MKFSNFTSRPITIECLYLTEGLKHIEHFEDNIINNGVDGLKQNIKIIKSIVGQLPVKTSGSNVVVSTKFDGSPSLVFGRDEMGFFVSTKSAFNKTPKFAYSDSDVDELFGSEGLKIKLKAALEYLSKLNVEGMYQGDILFTDEDKKPITIDGEKYISFTPNTITYTVPDDNSDISKEVRRAHIGIVVHTQYQNKNIDKPSFNVDISKFGKHPDVWLRDPFFKDESSVISFNIDEYKQIVSGLSELERLAKMIDDESIVQLRNAGLDQLFKQFENDLVRQGLALKNTNNINKLFTDFIENLIRKESDKLKTPEAKQKRMDILDKYKNILNNYIDDLQIIYRCNILFTSIKEIIINKLKDIKMLGSFVKKGDTYEVTSPEGFCVIDTDGSIFKLVDRLVFSRLNFLMSKNRT